MKIRWGSILAAVIILAIAGFFGYRKYLETRLARIDLQSILIQEGDLSANFSPGEALGHQQLGEGVVQGITQSIITAQGEEIGAVSVLLYSNKSAMYDRYAMMSYVESQEGIIPYPLKNIGDNCYAVGLDNMIVIGFTRCRAFSIISIDARYRDSYGYAALVEHARRLDERLAKIACGY